MTWLRKLQVVVTVLVVLTFVSLPVDNWIEAFTGVTF